MAEKIKMADLYHLTSLVLLNGSFVNFTLGHDCLKCFSFIVLKFVLHVANN